MATTRTKMTRSGFCILGQCEGTKPKSASGKPMPTCTAWDWCKCKCHKQVTKMYESVGLPREPAISNPEYQPGPRTYWMPGDPDPMPDEPLSNSGDVMAPPDAERTVNRPPVAAPTPSFGPTPTGRKARGQLEYEVLTICSEFAENVYDWEHCTPKLVAERIAKTTAGDVPSTGAINAVWDRWEKLGFAEQAKKPSRLVRFTGPHTVADLERLKARVKREKKRTKSEMRRGFRPAS